MRRMIGYVVAAAFALASPVAWAEEVDLCLASDFPGCTTEVERAWMEYESVLSQGSGGGEPAGAEDQQTSDDYNVGDAWMSAGG